jgi:hypothetical protein
MSDMNPDIRIGNISKNTHASTLNAIRGSSFPFANQSHELHIARMIDTRALVR